MTASSDADKAKKVTATTGNQSQSQSQSQNHSSAENSAHSSAEMDMNLDPAMQNNATQKTGGPNFQLHKIYLKECSFELPKGAEIFSKEWRPELAVQVGTATKALAETETHEVVLSVKCEVKSAGHEAFKIDLKMAGICTIRNLTPEQLNHTLGSFCPSVLYPYARETICELVLKGGFPQLNLAPINFDGLYQEEMARKKQATGSIVTENNKTVH